MTWRSSGIKNFRKVGSMLGAGGCVGWVRIVVTSFLQRRIIIKFEQIPVSCPSTPSLLLHLHTNTILLFVLFRHLVPLQSPPKSKTISQSIK